VHRAFTYRLDPTVKQARGLERLMVLQCELYNAALEERTMTYEWLKRGLSTKRVPSLFDQFKTLTGLRELRPEFGPFGISVCRGTLTRLDEAFQAYFRRIKAGEKPGYPRSRSAGSAGQRKKLGELLRWFHESECFARSVVETASKAVQVFLAVGAEIGALRHVLAE
jgi:hypothetical protein